MSSSYHKDPNRVASGLKASIHNPNVSDAAKARAREKLEKLQGGNVEISQVQSKLSSRALDDDVGGIEEEGVRPQLDASSAEEGVSNQVLGGYKATLHNPQVSEKAKANAKQVLDDYGASED